MKQAAAGLLLGVLILFASSIAGAVEETAGTTPAAPAETVQSADLPAAPAPAASESATNAPSPFVSAGMTSHGLDMLWALGAFILVMALLFLALKGLGRLSRFRGLKGGRSAFELRGIQALDNHKYLAAVAVEGRLIVVGVTPDRITPVAHWFLDEDGREDLDFQAAATLPPDPGPGLEVKLPEEEDHPLDISIADWHRDGRK